MTKSHVRFGVECKWKGQELRREMFALMSLCHGHSLLISIELETHTFEEPMLSWRSLIECYDVLISEEYEALIEIM